MKPTAKKLTHLVSLQVVCRDRQQAITLQGAINNLLSGFTFPDGEQKAQIDTLEG